MKKNNLKIMLSGVIIGAILTSGITAFASNQSIDIPVTFKNIKIFVDGAELTPRDSYGNVLEPFIYNGSTYLPVRAVAEAVGKEVSYDANTNSVYLGNDVSNAKDININGSILNPYDSAYPGIGNYYMGGIEYRNALGIETGPGYESKAYYNLGGKYSSISGLCGIVDGKDKDSEVELNFYGDDILIKKITIYGGKLPQNFSVNLSGVSHLVIEAHYVNGFYPTVALGELSFK